MTYEVCRMKYEQREVIDDDSKMSKVDFSSFSNVAIKPPDTSNLEFLSEMGLITIIANDRLGQKGNESLVYSIKNANLIISQQSESNASELFSSDKFNVIALMPCTRATLVQTIPLVI
jgi:hypothetical protein